MVLGVRLIRGGGGLGTDDASGAGLESAEKPHSDLLPSPNKNHTKNGSGLEGRLLLNQVDACGKTGLVSYEFVNIYNCYLMFLTALTSQR